MAEIRASFFIECEELLEALQDGLQRMYDGDMDDETVNVMFRAVHSIKGGAGAFGLDALVAFAHRFETALDEIRSGRLTPDAGLLKLFFQCCDILSDLVRESREGNAPDETAAGPVIERLDALIGGRDAPEEIDFQPMALSFDFEPETGETAPVPAYLIQFKPDAALYSSGNEPAFLLRALRDLGVMQVMCDETRLPSLDALEAESAHLEWQIELATAEPESAIREVFDFVDGMCALTVRPKEGAEEPADRPGPGNAAHDPGPGNELARGGAQPQPAGEAMPAPAPPKSPQQSALSPVPSPTATVRVDLERIDRLVNLVGEIVINQAMLSQSVEEADLPPNSPVRTGLEEFLQLTRDIQESVMMIRAQPVKSLFQRMSRIVREAGAGIGKEVRLLTEGENTEVDKTVIERLADPLTHMIRNAVDHGLESAEQRLSAGKPAEGTIFLTAMHRSGRVVIEVADDGGGIDRAKVRQIAIDKGLIPSDQPCSDSEIDNLLFLPGFSTAKTISNLSGRGVGMDVVRSAIQALGGRIAISSERGRGTAFSISLPLTLAVLDGMVVKVAGETLVVPLNAILETLSLGRGEIRAFGPETHVVNIRETFVPLLDLGAELGYRAPLDDYYGGVVLLIAQENGSRAAVVVDAIEDQRQVVIKGLQDSYGRVPGIAAATILGDGQIALILDPVDLITQAHGRTRTRARIPETLAG